MTAPSEVRIHDVWKANLEEEFGRMRALIQNYRFVAMDTEFPGVVATPLGVFRSKEDFNYQQVACNVNMLKLIQVGFALVDDNGDLPPSGDVWQFNFHFSVNEDMFSQESVEMLRVAGIDFTRLSSDGIHMEDFGDLLTTSGLLVDERITWLTFSSGYDFGYLLRTIIIGEIPKEESQFFEFHRTLFPRCYDIKLMLRMPGCMNAKLKGGLQEVADQLDVKRHGMRHQAGSDALLTAKTFFKIKQHFFPDTWDSVSPLVQGHMFGLGNSLSLSLSHSANRLDELVKDVTST